MSQTSKTIQKRTVNSQQALLERLKTSPIIEIACKKVGIARATYYRWRQVDKDFAKAADAALQEGKLLINDMAESQLINQIRDKHMTAIIFWLKHHHQDYANRVEVTTRSAEVDELSPEQQQLITKALTHASLLIKESNSEEENE
jgi:ACT domain-containing protein